MRVLVTGGDGFVGGWLARRLLRDGHAVVATCRPGSKPSPVLTPAESERIEWREMELQSRPSVDAAVQGHWDAVFHLAAMASGSEARNDPGLAWEINAAGTARLAEVLGTWRTGGADPLLLLASTGEVYGMGEGRPRHETDLPRPCSPYAASKLGAEVAVLEVACRTGLRAIIARAFPHTGPKQDIRFVAPALAGRLTVAKRVGAPVVKTGNLDVVRDFLDVRDVAAAYVALVLQGTPGEVYNVASGTGHAVGELLARMQQLVGWSVTAEPDARLLRRSDIRHLVGDPTKLRAATGWTPQISLDQTLRDLLDAQAD
ncbi:MAG: GDP-mannose 4,6-dehydratase [Gemmatimonadales bacterium]